MKATYKRQLAAAFAAMGLINLGVCQTSNATAPDQDVTASQTEENGAVLDTSDVPTIMINGTTVNFSDAQPGMINGQLMVPVRAVAECIGDNVDWRHSLKEVVITPPAQDSSVVLDTNRDWLAMISNQDQSQTEQFYNGETATTVDVGPSAPALADNEVVLIGDHAYMPFDQLAASLNGAGNWDQTADMATITTDQPTTSENNTEPVVGEPLNSDSDNTPFYDTDPGNTTPSGDSNPAIYNGSMTPDQSGPYDDDNGNNGDSSGAYNNPYGPGYDPTATHQSADQPAEVQEGQGSPSNNGITGGGLNSGYGAQPGTGGQ